MTSYTNINGLRLMVTGADSGTWGDNTNVNLQMLDAATKGVKEISLSGTTHTLTTTDGTLSDANYAVLVFAGSPTGTNTVTISPNDQTKLFFVQNNSGQAVVLTQGSGGNVTVTNGKAAVVYADGGGATAQVVDLTANFGDFLLASNNLSDVNSASTARTNLGLGTIATQNSNNVSITGGSVAATLSSSSVAFTGGSITGITDLAVADGGTGASTAADARTNLGVAIGSNVQAWDVNLDQIAALAPTLNNFIVGTGTSWALETPSSARTSLGLGTVATQNSTSVSITGGSITGITDLAIADGGTGASTAAAARSNLGLEIGVDVAAYDANSAAFLSTFTLPTADSTANYVLATDGNGTLQFVSTGSGDGSVTSVGLSGGTTGLTVSGSPITSFGTMTLGGTLGVANGGTGGTTASAARSSLGLAIGSDVQAYDADLTKIAALSSADGNIIVGSAAGWVAESGATTRASLGLAIGTDVQAYDADLTALGGLAKTNGNFIVGNGSTWVAESGVTARASLGLGSMATQNSTSVSITGGSITGITDLAVADGGTGASTAAAARTNLGVAIGYDVQAYSSNLTSWGLVGRASGFDAFVNSPTTANFAALITGETGTGAVVFNTSPTLVTPVLGTPTSGDLSNCTGTPTLNLSNSTGTPALDLSNSTADGTNEVGFRNVPAVGTKTTSYTLATGDVGKYVQVGTGGSITIPDATFSEGDVVSIFNNTSGDITITCSITTAYIAGNNLDKASVTLATRGTATILFISGTVCVMSGNIS